MCSLHGAPFCYCSKKKKEKQNITLFLFLFPYTIWKGEKEKKEHKFSFCSVYVMCQDEKSRHASHVYTLHLHKKCKKQSSQITFSCCRCRLGSFKPALFFFSPFSVATPRDALNKNGEGWEKREPKPASSHRRFTWPKGEVVQVQLKRRREDCSFFSINSHCAFIVLQIYEKKKRIRVKRGKP